MTTGRPIDFAEIFARAANAPRHGQAMPSGSHVAADEELLLRWALGELTAAEEDSLRMHLADCARCRREVAAMVRAGALRLPEPPAEDDLQEQTAAATPRAAPRGRRSYRTRMMTIAAVVAALVLVALLPTFLPNRSRQLALVRRDLDEGRPEKAMARAEALLEEQLDAENRAKAERLLEESVYVVGRKDLQQGRFDAVQAVGARLSRRAKLSGRVLNLAIQADRKTPAEYQLAQAGSLTHYGYTFRGYAGTKQLPLMDPQTEAIGEALASAASENPESVPVLLNYGQFLIENGSYPEATEVLSKALAREPDNALVHVALGLLAFDEERVEDALRAFERAAQLAPTSADAELNQAIALERLERSDEARPHFERAARLADDALRDQIERYLNP